jgi:hypothetical protein
VAKATKKSRPNQEALDRALAYFNEAKKPHQEFCRGVERRYKSWRGIIDTVKDPDSWIPTPHPPYILHIVETTLASLVEDRIRYRIRPRPTIEMMRDPAAAERLRAGAFSHQTLFDWQIKQDKFNQIQRPYLLQNAIARLSVAKTYWTDRSERRRQMVTVEEPLIDDMGRPVLDPMTGQQISIPRLEEKTGYVTVYDGPTTEVRDVRDFLWHESAVSLDKARYLIDRVWMGKEEIEEGFSEEGPIFGPEMGGWSKKECLKLLSTTADQSDEFKTREKELFNSDPTKDLIEVCEVWDQVRGEVVTFANGSVLLAYREEYPFFHESPPFTVVTTQPDLFRIEGISQVEKVEHLQELLWTLMSQRIANLELINNAIFFFRPDIEDPDAYPFVPGARWPVEDPTQVNMWTPNVIPAEVSLGAEALIKGDLQNLAGGFPFSSGTDSQVVDQKTATGASIVTSIAQRSIDLHKQQVYHAWEDIGQQRLILNQQFIREETAAPVIGLDDEEELVEIIPELLQGDFNFTLEPIPDALMKQEEQASAQALLQLAMSVVPAAAQLSQVGAAKMLNLDAFVEDTLQAFGKEDTNRYFLSKPAQAGPPAAGEGAPGGGGSQPQPVDPRGSGGVTASQSVDPAVSPSASISMAPSTLMHRAQALAKGGAQNL